jgi:hypothetical protein
MVCSRENFKFTFHVTAHKRNDRTGVEVKSRPKSSASLTQVKTDIYYYTLILYYLLDYGSYTGGFSLSVVD